MKPRTAVLGGAILLAALSRCLPHPWGFAPMTAMALFSGSTLANRRFALATPLVALLVSDLAIGVKYWLGWTPHWGLYSGMWVTYSATLLVTAIGLLLRQRRNVVTIAAGTLSGSIVFFAITNFAFVPGYDLYPHTWQGLVECYTLAIPFFEKSLMGDVFYATILFGGYALLEKWLPAFGQPALVPAKEALQ
jgi:hypothetical protein